MISFLVMICERPSRRYGGRRSRKTVVIAAADLVPAAANPNETVVRSPNMSWLMSKLAVLAV